VLDGFTRPTILLGHVTYEKFAGGWPHRSGATANFLNTAAKPVVSTTLEDACRQNTSLIDAMRSSPKTRETAARAGTRRLGA